MYSLLLVILPLLINAASKSNFPIQGRPSRSRFHRRRNSIFSFKNVKIIPDLGFYAFNYKNAGIAVGNSFYYHSDRPTVVTLLDCFCSGDSFQLFDNGVLLGCTEGSDVGDDTCPHFSSDPNVCLFSYENNNKNSNYWGLFGTVLNSGTHNLTIIPVATPYGKGTGFLRVDYSCPPETGGRKDNRDTTDSIFFPGCTFPCCVADNSCSVNTVN